MDFRLVWDGDYDLAVYEGLSRVASVSFPVSFPVKYGFSLQLASGSFYQLKSRGLFWWKKVRLFQGGESVGEVSSGQFCCDKYRVAYRRREYLYSGDEPICSVQKYRDEKFLGYKLVYKWEVSAQMDELMLVAVITVLLLSLQQNARAYASALP